MSVVSGDPDALEEYLARTGGLEEELRRAGSDLDEAYDAFRRACPDVAVALEPAGAEVARHADDALVLAGWVAAVGAAFRVADSGAFVGYLPGATRTAFADELDAYLGAIGAYATADEVDAHEAGTLLARRILAALEDGDGNRADELLATLADHEDDPAFLRGALLTLGPLDDLEEAIRAYLDRGNPVGRFFGGVWDSTTGILSTGWDLTGRVAHDPGGWAGSWGDLGSGLWWGVRNPIEFGKVIIDVEGFREDKARWAGSFVPDVLLALGTGGAGAAASRGGSATRSAMRALRTADNLGDRISALRDLTRALGVDIEVSARTAGGRSPRWTPVGQVDASGRIVRGIPTSAGGPLSRLGPQVGYNPVTTFRSGTYVTRRTEQWTTLYRVGNPGSGHRGNYWTPVRPSGPGQAQLDLALNPAWGNTAQELTAIRVPPGTIVYEGIAGPQQLLRGQPLSSGLPGGGPQVFLPDVSADWVVGTPRPLIPTGTP